MSNTNGTRAWQQSAAGNGSNVTDEFTETCFGRINWRTSDTFPNFSLLTIDPTGDLHISNSHVLEKTAERLRGKGYEVRVSERNNYELSVWHGNAPIDTVATDVKTAANFEIDVALKKGGLEAREHAFERTRQHLVNTLPDLAAESGPLTRTLLFEAEGLLNGAQKGGTMEPLAEKLGGPDGFALFFSDIMRRVASLQNQTQQAAAKIA